MIAHGRLYMIQKMAGAGILLFGLHIGKAKPQAKTNYLGLLYTAKKRKSR